MRAAYNDRCQRIHITAFQHQLYAVRQRRAHLGGQGERRSPSRCRPTRVIASPRQIRRRHAALSKQGPSGSAFNLNRDKRR